MSHPADGTYSGSIGEQVEWMLQDELGIEDGLADENVYVLSCPA